MSNGDEAYLYCAGLYEGEGTIGTTFIRDSRGMGTNKCRKLVLKICMTDVEPLELFEDIMQLGNITGPYELASGKKLYEYRVGKFEEVKLVIERMYEYLSPRRKRQADEAISKYLNYENRGLPRRKR